MDKRIYVSLEEPHVWYDNPDKIVHVEVVDLVFVPMTMSFEPDGPNFSGRWFATFYLGDEEMVAVYDVSFVSRLRLPPFDQELWELHESR